LSEISNISFSEVSEVSDIKKQDYKSKQEERTWEGDVTDKLLNRICPEIYPDEVDVRDLIIDGARGFGKTTKACKIAENCAARIEDFGHTWNKISVRSFQQVIPLFTTDPYQIVMIDDARRFNAKMTKELANEFNELRHEFEKIVSEGVIIIIWMIQDAYLIEREFRDQMCAIMYCSLKRSNWMRRDIRETVGQEYYLTVINMLQRITSGKYDEGSRRVLSNAIVVTETWMGYVYLEKSENPAWQPYKELTNEEGIKFLEPDLSASASTHIAWKLDSGDYTFEEIERFDVLSLILWGLNNWHKLLEVRDVPEIKKLEQKHIDAYTMWIQGTAATKIGSEFGVTRQAINGKYDQAGWIAIVQFEFIGHLLEWVLTQPGAPYENYTWVAGTGRVDLLSPDKTKAIEVKAREQYETPNVKMISGEMQKMLEEESHECELCQVVINKKQCLLMKFNIVKKDKYDKEKAIEGFT